MYLGDPIVVIDPLHVCQWSGVIENPHALFSVGLQYPVWSTSMNSPPPSTRVGVHALVLGGPFPHVFDDRLPNGSCTG